MERCDIVYHVDSDKGIDGIEVHEMASVMYSFAELVQATLDANDVEGDLEVKVRPFREGSFVAEFVLTLGNQVVTLLTSEEANALTNALAILGFVGLPTAVTLPSVIRRVKGHINEFKDNGDGTYSYGGLDVPREVHNVVQSKEVAKPFRNTTVGPIVNIGGGSVTVTIQDALGYRDGDLAADRFTSADIADFDMYEHVAVEGVPEDRDELVSVSHDVVLNPMSGPYDGAERGYTFKYGREKWHRVQMHDLDFRLKIKSGKIRFHDNDILVVDLETVQTYDRSGNLRISERRIIEVKKYIPYDPPDQLTIDDVDA